MVREVFGFAHIPGFTPSRSEDLGSFDMKQSESVNGIGKKVFVGVMGCSPLGGGVEASFEDLEYRKGVRASA